MTSSRRTPLPMDAGYVAWLAQQAFLLFNLGLSVVILSQAAGNSSVYQLSCVPARGPERPGCSRLPAWFLLAGASSRVRSDNSDISLSAALQPLLAVRYPGHGGLNRTADTKQIHRFDGSALSKHFFSPWHNPECMRDCHASAGTAQSMQHSLASGHAICCFVCQGLLVSAAGCIV